MLQLASVAMVVAVNARPVGVGNRAKEGTDEADGVVHFALLQKGIMAAIVLDDENANEKKGIYRAKGQGEPNRILYAEIHGNPQGNERAKAAKQLAYCAWGIGFLVFGNDRFPVPQTVIDFGDSRTGGLIQNQVIF